MRAASVTRPSYPPSDIGQANFPRCKAFGKQDEKQNPTYVVSLPDAAFAPPTCWNSTSGPFGGFT